MFCGKCGMEVPASDAFCGRCGNSMSVNGTSAIMRECYNPPYNYNNANVVYEQYEEIPHSKRMTNTTMILITSIAEIVQFVAFLILYFADTIKFSQLARNGMGQKKEFSLNEMMETTSSIATPYGSVNSAGQDAAFEFMFPFKTVCIAMAILGGIILVGLFLAGIYNSKSYYQFTTLVGMAVGTINIGMSIYIAKLVKMYGAMADGSADGSISFTIWYAVAIFVAVNALALNIYMNIKAGKQKRA